MRTKLLKAIKRFIELFTPGGTEYTPSGVAIIFDHWGNWRIPESDWEKLLFAYADKTKTSPLGIARRRKQGDTHDDLARP
ncbi:MAG: hypothetical protein JO042_01760 [Sinobacteraceae bacterium]|nr:hypothetical protein [Nevskiaceae bacterium]